MKKDIRDSAAVDAAVAGVDAVFHLAASVGNKRSIDQPVNDAEINVIGTLRVFEASRKAGVRKVVISSSAGILGELKALLIHEDSPAETDSPNGASELCAEKEGLAYSIRKVGVAIRGSHTFNLPPLARSLSEATQCSESEVPQIGLRGKQFVSREYSWTRIAEEFTALYRCSRGDGPKPACIVN